MRLIIHHHLGLGDHFVCNGLVRFIIDKNNYEQYYIPAKEQNFLTVKEMYSDLNNVENFLQAQTHANKIRQCKEIVNNAN